MSFNKIVGALACLCALGSFAACSGGGGGGGGSSNPAPTPPQSGNNAPVPVLSTPDGTSFDSGATFRLDATSSTDADGDQLTFTWTQTGNAQIVGLPSNSSQLTLTAPFVTQAETVSVELAVSDGLATRTTTVDLTFNPAQLGAAHAEFGTELNRVSSSLYPNLEFATVFLRAASSNSANFGLLIKHFNQTNTLISHQSSPNGNLSDISLSEEFDTSYSLNDDILLAVGANVTSAAGSGVFLVNNTAGTVDAYEQSTASPFLQSLSSFNAVNACAVIADDVNSGFDDLIIGGNQGITIYANDDTAAGTFNSTTVLTATGEYCYMRLMPTSPDEVLAAFNSADNTLHFWQNFSLTGAGLTHSEYAVPVPAGLSIEGVAFVGDLNKALVAIALSDGNDEGINQILFWSKEGATVRTEIMSWTRGVPTGVHFLDYYLPVGSGEYSPNIIVTLRDYPQMLIFDSAGEVSLSDVSSAYGSPEVIDVGIQVDDLTVPTGFPAYLVISSNTDREVLILGR